MNNRTPDGGINETLYVDINGDKQWINIYGQDKNNPVLLYLHGGPGQATSEEDYAAAARILSKFADSNKDFTIKSGYLEGEVIGLDTISSLAKLPTRDVLLATVCNAFNAPIASFARAVQAIVDNGGVEESLAKKAAEGTEAAEA